MKFFQPLAWSAPLLGLVFAISASAQREQWLQYRTTTELRSYRWLELTTNAPPGVALPKLIGRPYFARWTTPLDPKGGRWMCFDRTRRSGPWNRVFVDRNGNGRLDDETAADATRAEDYAAYFEPQKLVFKGEDGPLTYHLVLRFMRYDADDVRLLVSAGCQYSGKVDLGGKKRIVTLVDGNVNGLFNDVAPDPYDCDRILIEGDKTDERFLGRLLEIDNQLYQLEVARDGAFLKIKKAENVTLGQVRVPEGLSEFVALGENGHFVRKPAKGELTLPVGKYRIHGWTIDRKDDKGATWKLSGSGFNASADFEVAAGKPAALAVGEPVRPALTASETKGSVAFGLRLKGRLGETVELLKGADRPRAPRLLLASTSSSYRATNNFEYG